MKTPFYEIEASLGARFEEYAGWELPYAYSVFADEYNSVRQRVGVIDLSFRGRVRVEGKERGRFLQSMLTNDVEKLPIGSGVHAALLTNKGRMVGYMRVYNMGESYMLDIDHRSTQAVLETLTNYKLSMRVTIADVNSESAALSIQGPYAPNLLVDLVGDDVRLERELDHVEAKLDLSHLRGVEPDHLTAPIRILRIGHTGEVGFDLLVNNAEAKHLWARVRHLGENYGLEAVGMNALDVLRLEAGIPWFGRDLDSTTIPLEAGLEHAISFTKGCYIGQETIVMIKHRGHINRKLVGMRVEGELPPNPGCLIVADQTEVGRITSAVYSPMLGCSIALGYVKRDWMEPGTQFILKAEAGETHAEVVQLPFLVG
jgi:glycine cleavage system T protein